MASVSRLVSEALSGWRSRPADQLFSDLPTLEAAARDYADASKVEVFDTRELVVKSLDDNPEALRVESSSGLWDLTHWSFGQLCQRVGAPAGYHRGRDPRVVAMDLNWDARVGKRGESGGVQLFGVQGPGGRRLDAITSPTYGRVYDHKVVGVVREVTDGGSWQVPSMLRYRPEHDQVTTLAWSDRSMFLFLADESRPIEIPGHSKPAYRGVCVWNSMVGARAFGIATFLYLSVCANRMILTSDLTGSSAAMRMRHTLGAPERFKREGRQLLADFAGQSDQAIVGRIKRAQELEVGKTDKDVLGWLARLSFTRSEATGIVEAAVREEGQARSVWDLTQGATAYARGFEHADTRFDFEQRVPKILERAA